jgi:hypothetical protein
MAAFLSERDGRFKAHDRTPGINLDQSRSAARSFAGAVPASGVCNDDDVNTPGATRLLSAARKIERRSIAPRAPIRIGNVSAAARSMDAFCQVGILEIRQQRQCFKIEDRYQFAVDRDQLVLA